MGISDEQRIIKALKTMPGQCAQEAVLAEVLRRSPGGDRWTAELLRAKVVELDDSDASAVFLTHDGVSYFGAENLSGSGLYKIVAEKMPTWARSRHLGPVEVEIFGRALPAQSGGTWSHPDMVVTSQRRVGGAPQNRTHVLEVESAKGFDMPSVYQAFEQARGADYAWVFFCGGTPIRESNRTRIETAARDIGVGLVAMPKPSRPSGWKLLVQARNLKPSAKERRDLHARLYPTGSGSND